MPGQYYPRASAKRWQESGCRCLDRWRGDGGAWVLAGWSPEGLPVLPAPRGRLPACPSGPGDEGPLAAPGDDAGGRRGATPPGDAGRNSHEVPGCALLFSPLGIIPRGSLKTYYVPLIPNTRTRSLLVPEAWLRALQAALQASLPDHVQLTTSSPGGDSLCEGGGRKRGQSRGPVLFSLLDMPRTRGCFTRHLRSRDGENSLPRAG